MKYKYLLIVGILLSLSNGLIISAASPDNNTFQGILKLKTYQYNPITDSFSSQIYGSAVFIGQGRIITNAHVILDKDSKTPTGLYQVCYSFNTKNAPICTAGAKLKAYDTVADLALLEIVKPNGINPLKISNTVDIDLGSSVVMYGYPNIGGNTITRTEGKIAGTVGDMYKIDGTIDHGNSGGGAFDKNGNLIGIPTAVASDNGVIGYMIPANTINEFLAGKTDNYTLYKDKTNSDFSKYASKIQSIYKNTKLIKDGSIKIGDSTKFDFNFIDTNRSKDNNIYSYQYSDKSGRVDLYISCTQDAGTVEAWDAANQSIKSEKESNKDYAITDEWIGSNKNIYSITYTPVKYDNSEKKSFSKILYFKNFDKCYARINADNGETDKKSIQKALDFILSGVSFTGKFVLDTKYSSPFLKANLVPPSAIRIVSYISALTKEQSMSVSFQLTDKRWITSDLNISSVKKLEDLFTIDTFKDLPKFNGPYSLENFRSRIEQVIKNNAVYITVSKNKKPFIMTTYWSDKNKANINIIYPYKVNDSQFVILDWNFDYTVSGTSEFYDIEKFFNSVDLPGTPAFSGN